MDYSASMHGDDHAVGASPWGTSPMSSPQASQTRFGAIAGDSPPSPALGSQISGNGFGAEQDEGGFGQPGDGFRRPDTASTLSEGDTQAQLSDTEGEDAGGRQHQPDAYQDENLSPSQAHDPNRLSGSTARASQEQAQAQVRKPTGPVYKLQAKITGLERAARKDPILRFDVHASWETPIPDLGPYADHDRPTFQSFERPSSAMSGVCTPSSSS